jgi:hypothetical protein
MSPEPSKPITGRRTVCDHCRRRRKSPFSLSLPKAGLPAYDDLIVISLQLFKTLSTDRRHIL